MKSLLFFFSLCLAACGSIPHREGTIKIFPSMDRMGVDVDAAVNGKEIRFQLDTGADMNVVISNDGLQDPISQGTSVVRNNFIGKTEGVDFKAKIKVGTLEEQELTTHYDPKHKKSLLSIQSYLSDKIQFEFKNGLIILGGDKPPCEPKEKFKFLRNSIILIRLPVLDKKIWFAWDTGTTHSIVDLNWAKENTILKDLPQTYQAQTDNGMSKPVSHFVELQTSVAGAKLKGEFFAVDIDNVKRLFSEVSGLIGYNMIKQKSWYFDLNSKKFCIYK